MDYTKYSDKAKSKIEKYGGAVKITRTSEERYNPQTNSYISDKTYISGKGILSNYASNEINGTLIQQGDVKLMCYLGDKPVIDDVLEIGGIEYLVKDISQLNPDGNTVIYYNLQLRTK